MACILGVYGVLTVGGILFRVTGITVSAIAHRSIFLGITLATAFLLYPARKSSPKDRLPWYDILLACLALLPTAYVAIFTETVYAHLEMYTITPVERGLCILLFILILEAARRSIGVAMPIIAALFFVYPMAAGYFPGFLKGAPASSTTALSIYYLSTDGIFTIPVALVSGVIFIFIFFGQVLLFTGAGDFFLKLALSLVGGIRGGAAKASVLASCFFGMLSGSGVANVFTTGVITIPLMKRTGYSGYFAGAVEAVASNGGQLMPPVMGAVAFIIAKMLGMPFYQVCIYAALPALLYYFAILVQIDLEAAKNNIKGLDPKDIPPFLETLKRGWFYLLPLFLLVFLLVVPRWSPTTACFISLVSLLLISCFIKGHRPTGGRMASAFEGTLKTLAMLAPACAAAGVIMAAVGFTALGLKLSGGLVALSGGNKILLLLMTAVVSFILGMGLSSIPCYLMVALLIAPTLVKMGVAPIAAHLFAFWWGIISFITPPVAITAYAAASVAKSDMFKTAWQASKLGVVAYVLPFFFCLNPALVLKGSLLDIAMGTATAIAGVIFLSAGIVGFFYGLLDRVQRVLLIMGGLSLAYASWYADIFGCLCVLPVLAWQVHKRKNQGCHPIQTS